MSKMYEVAGGIFGMRSTTERVCTGASRMPTWYRQTPRQPLSNPIQHRPILAEFAWIGPIERH